MSDFFEWLANEIAAIISGIIDSFYNGLVAVLALIPVPDAFTNAATLMAQVPESVMYFIYLFQIPYGLTVLIPAMSARFLIRRIM
jgi:hypothetical protein